MIQCISVNYAGVRMNEEVQWEYLQDILLSENSKYKTTKDYKDIY